MAPEKSSKNPERPGPSITFERLKGLVHAPGCASDPPSVRCFPPRCLSPARWRITTVTCARGNRESRKSACLSGQALSRFPGSLAGAGSLGPVPRGTRSLPRGRTTRSGQHAACPRPCAPTVLARHCVSAPLCWWATVLVSHCAGGQLCYRTVAPSHQRRARDRAGAPACVRQAVWYVSCRGRT